MRFDVSTVILNLASFNWLEESDSGYILTVSAYKLQNKKQNWIYKFVEKNAILTISSNLNVKSHNQRISDI